MDNELLATYYILHRVFNVYGCWNEEATDEKFDFYDVYENGKSGEMQHCINDGEPFFKMPTRNDIKKFIKTNNL